MKKVALPVNGNTLSPHFGQSECFRIFEIRNRKVAHIEDLKAPGLERGGLPYWLTDLNITDVITCGIGYKAIELFNQNKINVFVGVETKDAIEVVNDFLNGTMVTNGNQYTR